MRVVFLFVQILTASLLIVLIALQGKGSGLSGGITGVSSQTYHSRKGVEKLLFRLTIAFGVTFLLSSVAGLLL